MITEKEIRIELDRLKKYVREEKDELKQEIDNHIVGGIWTDKRHLELNMARIQVLEWVLGK